ncbi:hypothetical protein BJX76DRAFT_359511 [Aspergillus varians]
MNEQANSILETTLDSTEATYPTFSQIQSHPAMPKVLNLHNDGYSRNPNQIPLGVCTIKPQNRHPSLLAAIEYPNEGNSDGDGVGDRNGDADGDITASEEEIISDLNEAALSTLPVHLQNNMRKIQAERIQQWQKDQTLHRSRYPYRQDRVPGSGLKLESEPKPGPRDKEYGNYVERWFKDMVAKVAATRELEVKRVMGEAHDDDDNGFANPENMNWCPVRHAWVPAYYGQGQEEKRKYMDGDGLGVGVGSGRARLCGIGGQDKAPDASSSEADTAIAKNSTLVRRHDRRGSSPCEYMSWRCSGPYYVNETQAGRDSSQHGGQPRKRISSAFSTARECLHTKFQWVKDISKK